jgi:hypothetical protein
VLCCTYVLTCRDIRSLFPSEGKCLHIRLLRKYPHAVIVLNVLCLCKSEPSDTESIFSVSVIATACVQNDHPILSTPLTKYVMSSMSAAWMWEAHTRSCLFEFPEAPRFNVESIAVVPRVPKFRAVLDSAEAVLVVAKSLSFQWYE